MCFSQLHQSIKHALTAVNDPTSDPDDDTSQMSEDMSVDLSATVCQPFTLETDNELSCPTPPNLTQKRKKSQSADSIELEKLKVLQEMSNAFQMGRSRPAADSDSTFGAQVTEELRLIKNTLIKSRVKRKIMNALYEAQECDHSDLLPSTQYQMPLVCPPPPTVQIAPSQPSPLLAYTPTQAHHQMSPPCQTYTCFSISNQPPQHNDQE